ncbi:MAG: hypothetical protein OK456_08025 [Thaumarchaeota archaeon]|nr:hypothetical protein [Nitrososphaerota archaeon]
MVQLESEVKLRVFATISPTEDKNKVLTAVTHLLGECAFIVEEGAGGLRIASEDPGCLRLIHDQLRDRHVRSAARRLMLKQGRLDNGLRLLFNRQAAFAGVVSLCSDGLESPLGPIIMEIESKDPDLLIDWLTPRPEGEPQE